MPTERVNEKDEAAAAGPASWCCEELVAALAEVERLTERHKRDVLDLLASGDEARAERDRYREQAKAFKTLARWKAETANRYKAALEEAKRAIEADFNPIPEEQAALEVIVRALPQHQGDG